MEPEMALALSITAMYVYKTPFYDHDKLYLYFNTKPFSIHAENGKIIVTTPAPGRIIGKRGWRIRNIRTILRYLELPNNVTVVRGEAPVNKFSVSLLPLKIALENGLDSQLLEYKPSSASINIFSAKIPSDPDDVQHHLENLIFIPKLIYDKYEDRRRFLEWLSKWFQRFGYGLQYSFKPFFTVKLIETEKVVK